MTRRDHGGGLDQAIARYGGRRADWLDLSTGINPDPYPVPEFSNRLWGALPDHAASDALSTAARACWKVPNDADILAAPGASALIAALPSLWPRSSVQITAPTYNEHAAAFRNWGWTVTQSRAETRVIVHPNNPTGALWDGRGHSRFLVIDESFCDPLPEASQIARATTPGVVILKSFGKFWGLAGLRLGFAIGHPDTIAPLRARLGPWAVSGPALALGAEALADADWIKATRARLARDSARLAQMLSRAGAENLGGTPLFRLASVPDAGRSAEYLAGNHRILVRVFPYSRNWLRFGLPAGERAWQRLQRALDAWP